ncbi:MAG TPA: group II intron reverse transcriptase/maturase [Candidatus Paceibacterota bacterium]|nr:group II intron reverse transcriptase/maturase [Candidatus Paceibacterota bacterium]
MKDTQLQISLPGVPKAKQGREVAPRWAWTEAGVWPERMLATLERGIEGGKWYSLYDKVWKMQNLERAVEKVTAGKSPKKADGRKCRRYAQHSPQRLPELQAMLKEGKYHPRPAQRIWIPKLGSKEMRPLGVPPVENRVVEMALRNVLEPMFEHTFAEHSYGFRPGRGAKDALRRVAQLLAAGKRWIVDADLKGYFDSIPQDKLLAAVAERVADGAVLKLIERFLKQGVMESGKGWNPTETGTPPGAVLSPLLANIYLNPLDQWMAGKGWEMVRYADDFIILCENQEKAQAALQEVRQWVEQAGLTLHPTKTRLVDANQTGGFDFLGYHFERGMRWPRQKSLEKFKEAIRQKTQRTRSDSMKQIIEETNRTLRGWFNYFQHSIPNIFESLDQWIRGRLRSVLRKRHKGNGRARGNDHQRWPNAYFAELGLISLALARAKAANARKEAH